MGRNTLRMKTNNGIVRVIMRKGTVSEAQMRGRGALAAKYYHENIRKLRFQYEGVGDPFTFDRHHEQESVRTAKVKVDVVANTITISPQAASAKYIEEGNRPSIGDEIRAHGSKFLAIPIKGSLRIFFVESVKPSKIDFKQPLLRAVKKAFRR